MGLKIFNRRGRAQEQVRTNHPDLVGFCMLWPGATPPPGWLLCDGNTFVSATYPLLAARLGITWGNPGGGNTQLPDFRGRKLVGVGTHADVNAIADTDGQAVGNRRPSHTHAAISAHNHTANHNHGAASHSHTAGGSHAHGSANHVHSTQAHGHGVSGATSGSNNNVSADGVGAGSGTQTRNSVHTHGAGTLVGNANDLGITGGIQNNVNGGVTESTTPGSTGSGGPGTHPSNGTEVSSTDLTASADAAGTPFLALHWVIKAEA